MGALLDLEIPGLDELMGLHQICDILSQQPPRFQHLVWDSAPTGHTLRLLQLPPMMEHWVRVVATISWKYRDLIMPSLMAAEDLETNDLLLTLKLTIRRFTGILTDPHRSRLMPVTIPEPMAGAETLRLIAELRQLRIPVDFAIVNRTWFGRQRVRPSCRR